MKCFNHSDRDGVGVCRVCGKSICRECATMGTMGLVCKGDCEKAVTNLGGHLEDQKKRVAMIKTFSGYYALVIGLLLIVFGFSIGSSGMLREIVVVIALALVLYGIWLIRRNKKGK